MRHPARPLGVLQEPADQEDAGLHQPRGVSGAGADRAAVACAAAAVREVAGAGLRLVSGRPVWVAPGWCGAFASPLGNGRMHSIYFLGPLFGDTNIELIVDS